ncbi:unnamed protein product [Rhizophagus irregularis]|nr:unnamed protein product [Rhizophagus irregularis]
MKMYFFYLLNKYRFRICFVFLCCIENVLPDCDWFDKFILWDDRGLADNLGGAPKFDFVLSLNSAGRNGSLIS